uniref:Uncharacterized protein n=1 Tax=Zooxanthella nutricula TaxID=1333877 RepID=A0A6V0BIN5_9DINO
MAPIDAQEPANAAPGGPHWPRLAVTQWVSSLIHSDDLDPALDIWAQARPQGVYALLSSPNLSSASSSAGCWRGVLAAHRRRIIGRPRSSLFAASAAAAVAAGLCCFLVVRMSRQGFHSDIADSIEMAADCGNLEEGTRCYRFVMWAKLTDIAQHPEAYDGLTPDAAEVDIQRVVHQSGLGGCPKPCTPVTMPGGDPRDHTLLDREDQHRPGGERQDAAAHNIGCHDAMPGDQCFVYVKWAMRTGVFEHPGWYKGLTADSPFEDYQHQLHQDGHGECLEPCRSAEADAKRSPFRDVSGATECSTPKKGDQCYENIVWARETGVQANPQWYLPLNSRSTFAQFQVLLHDEGHGGCDLPCVEQPSSTTTTATTAAFSQVEASRAPSTTPTTFVRTDKWSGVPESWHPVSGRYRRVTNPKMSTPSTSKGTVTTTTTLTTTLACVPRQFLGDPSLFCFSVVQLEGGEIELVKQQWQRRMSIFSCDAFAVISTMKVSLGKDECGNDIWTWVNDLPSVPLGKLGKPGVTTSSYLNTKTFLMAWDTLIHSGKLWSKDYVVKADPDCVWFPARLRHHIADKTIAGRAPRFFLNCGIYGDGKMFGALEVYSVDAIRNYEKGSLACKTKLKWHGWGEDLFMETCMRMVGAQGVEDFQLVGDARCRPTDCSDATSVGYHPFKDVTRYENCYDQSRNAESSFLTRKA